MPRIQELGLQIPTTRRPILEYGMRGISGWMGVSKGSIENMYTPLNDVIYKLPATVNRFKIEYTTNLIAKTLNFIQPFIGYHDMRIPTVYPNLSAYPKDNRLINTFLSTNPSPSK